MATEALSREERARRIARYVAAKVSEVAPPGLGHWDGAWKIVADPSERFLDALNGWEQNGSADDRAAVQDAGRRLVAAWRRAAELWEENGCPQAREVAGAA